MPVGGRADGRWERLFALAIVLGVALVCVWLGAQGSILFGLVAIGMAGFLLLVVATGTATAGTVALALAFATAPVYKGLAPSPDSPVTPTDLLLVVGFGLLLPTLLGQRLHLPFPFLVGLTGVLVTGVIGAVVGDQTILALFSLTLWLGVMGGIPIMMAWWSPPPRVIDTLLWCYVGGHMISVAYAVVDGPGESGRYGGLATHFNYFAQAGLLSCAILLFLFGRSPHLVHRLAVIGTGVIAVASIQMSGSRAAVAVLAALVLMIPVVERSAVTGFLFALGGALVVAALPLLITISGEDSALGRLAGGGGSEFSDQARALGREEGIARFLDHPLTGSGVADLFEIHNNYLQVAVALGVFGTVAYLLVLFTFARPLFGDGPDRRLCYTVWAYIGFGATTPGLYDRGIWIPVSLSMVAAISWWERGRRQVEGVDLRLTPEAVPPREAPHELRA